jgi:lysozyme
MFKLLRSLLAYFTSQEDEQSEEPESHQHPHTIPAFEAKEIWKHGEKPNDSPKITEKLTCNSKELVMKINDKAIEVLKKFEGLSLKAYRDSVNVLTIGYGHTGMDVLDGLNISQEQAEELLKKDLDRFEKGVSNLVLVPLTSNQFSALVVFSYNVGLGNFQNSTLLKKLNAKDFIGASAEFSRWNKAGGRVLNGLTTRREAERQLFLLP